LLPEKGSKSLRGLSIEDIFYSSGNVREKLKGKGFLTLAASLFCQENYVFSEKA